MDQRIFKFSGSTCEWKGDQKKAKAILGGKGAGLVMMAKDGLNVPPGFTLTTDNCNAYLALSPGLRETFMDILMEEVSASMAWLTKEVGYTPLVSVRSGAAVSMPGMMDTILNVGLCNDNFKDWWKRIGGRATHDSDRRLTQMLGATAYGVPMAVFDFQLAKVKKELGVKLDTELDVLGLSAVISAYRKAFEANKGFKFPFDDPKAQLRAAIKAVFESWMNPRAIEYRKINKLDDKMGTAVTVQAMVFGNMGEDSGTGVLFSRNPSTGEPGMMGEFLTNAQGEDVVAGIRTPVSVAKMPDLHLMVKEDDQGNEIGNPAEVNLHTMWWEVHWQLTNLCKKLETSYKDMVDIEFTVQQGKLFVLQSRTGKRSAMAAFKIAVQMEAEGVIDRKTAISRLTVDQFKVVRRPSIDPKFKGKPDFTGLPACPGVVTGKPVFSADYAVKCKEPCILVTHETNPNDIAGMAAAVGILTQTGGATSHAAVVARAMDKACITGCTDLDWPKVKAAKKVTIDGSTGRVWVGVDVPVIDSSNAPEVRKVLDWCQAVLGTCEVAPVDMGMDQPHRVMAAYWWGQQEVLDAVLDGLAELPSREHVALDLRGPNSFAPETDAILLHAFGEPGGDKFETILYSKLTARAGQLKGLRLLNVEMDFAHPVVLLDMGFGVEGTDGMQLVPKAAPAEYAAFTVLAR